MELHRWERETLAPLYGSRNDGSPGTAGGTRLTFVGPHGRLATVVRYPGTLWRVYWLGSTQTSDFRTETMAIQAVETRFGV